MARAELTRTEQLLQTARQTPLSQQLIPVEAGHGWPLPHRTRTGVYMKIPYFGYAATERPGIVPLYPPFAVLTVTWPSGKPVEYLDLRYTGQCPDDSAAIGTFPHPAVAAMTPAEYLSARSQMYSLYDTLFDTLVSRGAFPSALTDAFRKHFRLLVEPSLLPTYRELAPNFMNHFLDPTG